MKHGVCYLPIALLLSIYSVCSWGQNFKRIGVENGLSSPSVLAIYQDTLGRMWFGTREGVNIYNSKEIFQSKSYNIVDRQQGSRQFVNGVVSHIEGNAQGDVFLKNNGLLIKYDIKKDYFKKVCSFKIGGIDKVDGELICFANDSIFKYNALTDSLDYCHRFKTPPICCMKQMNQKTWIGTVRGLYVSENNRVRCLLPDVEISQLFVSSRKELWVASRMNGLYRMGEDGILRKEECAPGRVVSEQIRDFVEDNEGNIWFGTFEGLQKYDPLKDSFSVYVPGYHPNSLSHQSVFSLYKDKQNTIWIGTYYGGVNYFNAQNDVFYYYPSNQSEKNCLSSPLVGQMIEDNDHDLWICTDGGGINRLNQKSGRFTYYRASQPNSILHDNVKTIAYDEKHNYIYIGTYTGGLSRYDKDKGEVYNYLTHCAQETAPGRLIYYSYFKDGYLYVSANNGLWRLDSATNQFVLLDRELFLTFMIDSKGWMWLVDNNFRTYRMKVGEWKLKEEEYLKTLENQQIKVTRIIEASDGMLYFSTMGKGVFTYSYEMNTWTNLSAEGYKLLSDFCYNLVETPMNNILISSDKGFSIFSPFNHSVYSIEKGMERSLSAITEEGGICVTANNLIYIGMINGMVSFNEKKLYAASRKPALFFSNLYINNSKVQPSDNGILQCVLPFTKHLDLSSSDNNIAVDFFKINYTGLEANIWFQYQLEGFDKKWITTNQNRVSYTNLAPGDYVLKVREIRNSLQEAPPEEFSLSIKIHNPWYATLWAFALYIIVVSSICIILWKIRASRNLLASSLEKEKEEKARREEINQMKLHFFTNLSHEFRTPLTLITSQIDLLILNGQFSPKILKRLHGIHKNALHLQELISELLDFRKQEQGYLKLKVELADIVSFIKNIYDSFCDLSKMRNITYTFECMEGRIDLWFDPLQMQKVVFNLLSNAFKYTSEGKSIHVHVVKLQNTVEICIKDTGCGIPAEALPNVFERFYRVDTFTEKYTAGTGLGLALAKGIIDAHRGSITVDSEEGRGSSFKIQLLQGNHHFAQEELKHDQVTTGFAETSRSIAENYQNAVEYEKTDTQLETEKTDDRHKRQILLVEDNNEVLDILETIFSPLYKTYRATNGAEGFEVAKQICPDLVVSDVMMPVMSGKEMCYKMKNNLELAHIPVVLLTAQTSLDQTIEGYMFGADDYIAKPFDVKLLLTRCENLIKNRGTFLRQLDRQETAPISPNRILNQIDKDLYDKAVTIIKSNFDNPDFDMSALAEGLHMSRSKMFTYLKEIAGLTPNELTLKLKLEEAIRIFQEEPHYNVTEVSILLGFTSARYFSRCFKDYYGISPLKYKGELKQ